MKLNLNLEINGINQEISMDDARGLYFELKKLFAMQEIARDMITPISGSSKHGSTPEPDVHVIREKGTSRPAPKTAPVESKKPNDKYANSRVEAAKERAAVRTSGCGSRR